MIPEYLTPLANHAWQSTLFAGIAGLLSHVFRKNRARIRYWFWLAASVKFLIPFSILIWVGNQVRWQRPPTSTQSQLFLFVTDVGEPFTSPSRATAATSVPFSAPSLAPNRVAAGLLCVWLCGFVINILSWLGRWRSIRMLLLAALPLKLDIPIQARLSSARVEPGVFGILKPILLLPDGIADRLTSDQMNAILIHELCHVRRHDNLAAAIHMLVEALFWFHPLVWWIEDRLVEERERACDEEVLRVFGRPDVYAEGILNVCRFCVQTRMVCISGVTGANLRKRIEEIIANRIGVKLDPGRTLLLAALGMIAIGGPIAIGFMNPSLLRAQSEASSITQPEFEVASVKRVAQPTTLRGVSGVIRHGTLTMEAANIRQMIGLAYGIQLSQVQGGPSWLKTEQYSLIAKAARTDANREQIQAMLQTLLADRFKLKVHRDTKEARVFMLVVGKDGPRLEEAKDGEKSSVTLGRGQWDFRRMSLAGLVNTLATNLGCPVLDKTGLTGIYNYKLQWSGANAFLVPENETSSQPIDSGPSIFTALKEQLGLKLETQRGKIEILVIDHVEQASEN